MKNKQGLIGIFEGMTKNQKTQMGVAKAQVYFTQLGYICHPTPPDCQCDWDMIIAKPNKAPLKVQIKTTGNAVSGGKNYAVGLKDGHYVNQSWVKTPKDYDVLYALDADGDESVWTQDELKNYKHSVHMKK
mgnify:FL=1